MDTCYEMDGWPMSRVERSLAYNFLLFPPPYISLIIITIIKKNFSLTAVGGHDHP